MSELKTFRVPAAGKSWGEAQDEEEARQQQEDDAEEAVDHEGDGGHREGVLHLILRHNQMSQCAQISHIKEIIYRKIFHIPHLKDFYNLLRNIC